MDYIEYGRDSFNPYNMGSFDPCSCCNKKIQGAYGSDAIPCPDTPTKCPARRALHDYIRDTEVGSRVEVVENLRANLNEYGPPIKYFTNDPWDYMKSSYVPPPRYPPGVVRRIDEKKEEPEKTSKHIFGKRRIIWEPKKHTPGSKEDTENSDES